MHRTLRRSILKQLKESAKYATWRAGEHAPIDATESSTQMAKLTSAVKARCANEFAFVVDWTERSTSLFVLGASPTQVLGTDNDRTPNSLSPRVTAASRDGSVPLQRVAALERRTSQWKRRPSSVPGGPAASRSTRRHG